MHMRVLGARRCRAADVLPACWWGVCLHQSINQCYICSNEIHACALQGMEYPKNAVSLGAGARVLVLTVVLDIIRRCHCFGCKLHRIVCCCSSKGPQLDEP
jgi:hypothetical protein